MAVEPALHFCSLGRGFEQRPPPLTPPLTTLCSPWSTPCLPSTKSLSRRQLGDWSTSVLGDQRPGGWRPGAPTACAVPLPGVSCVPRSFW